MKLTESQLNLLNGIYHRGTMHVAEYYKPSIKLIEYGLVERDAHGKLKLTVAGADAVKEVQP